MFKCKNKASPKAFENLFTLKPKNKYQLKRSCTFLEPFCKSEFSQWNTIVLSQNTDLEQSTALKFWKRKCSFLTMLNFCFDIVLYKNRRMSHKELISLLSK